MRFTRRYWATASLTVLLVVGSVVLVQPVLLFGAALIGGWLLARQYAFITELRATLEGLDVTQTVDRDHVVSDTPVVLTVTAVLARASSLELHVDGGVPVTATTSEDAELSIDPGAMEATRVLEIRWEVAGTFALDQATASVADPYGLFVGEFSLGNTRTVTVEPRGPRSIHLGRAGERIRRALGEHEADPLDVGLEPEEVRQYVPGDTVRMIDWKATARLNTPHVRTFETEADRTTVLVFDRRRSMGEGPEGETKLDYARHVGLLFVQEAMEGRDPLGLYAVDEQGTSLRLPPTGTKRGYASIRAQLYDITASARGPNGRRGDPRVAKRQRTISHLTDDDSTFATVLKTYLSRGRPRTPDSTSKPLLATTRANLSQLRGSIRTVIVTDDAHPRELHETVMYARRGNNRVIVVLAPTVLYAPEGMSDLETAYERYREFESYRRSLDSIARVDALELAPGDKLSSVLAAGRRERAQTR